MRKNLTFKALIAFLLIAKIFADCPLSHSPRDTIIGFIDAKLNNDPASHNKYLNFEHILEQPVSEIPKVAVAVTGMDYDVGSNRLSYDIAYTPIGRFTKLVFVVRVSDDDFGWRRLKFTFLSSTSNLVEFNILQVALPLVRQGNGYPLTVRTFIPKMAQTDSKLQIFLSGIDAKLIEGSPANSSLDIKLQASSFLIEESMIHSTLLVGAETEVFFISISLVIFGSGLIRENLNIFENSVALTGQAPPATQQQSILESLLGSRVNGGFGGNLEENNGETINSPAEESPVAGSGDLTTVPEIGNSREQFLKLLNSQRNLQEITAEQQRLLDLFNERSNNAASTGILPNQPQQGGTGDISPQEFSFGSNNFEDEKAKTEGNPDATQNTTENTNNTEGENTTKTFLDQIVVDTTTPTFRSIPLMAPSPPDSKEGVYSIPIQSLQNMEMFILGIRGFSLNTNGTFIFELVLDEGQKVESNSFLGFHTQVNEIPRAESRIQTAAGSTFSALYLSYSGQQRRSNFLCTECIDSPIIFERFCISECPSGYARHYDQNLAILYCEFCNITELFIPNSEKTQCICAKQHHMTRAEICESCHFTCLQCTGKQFDQCLSCDTEQSFTNRQMSSGRQCQCPPGFYNDPEMRNIVCLKCHRSCLTCEKGGERGCLDCAAGRQKSNLFCICSNGFYEDANRECACESPRYLQDGKCISPTKDCEPNEVFVEATLLCECDPSSHFIDGKCVKCFADQTYNAELNECICEKGNKSSKTQQCIICSLTEKFNIELEQCICKNNFIRNEQGICESCPKRSETINGKCECIFNYYSNGSQCVRCTKSSDGPKCLNIFEE